MLIRAVQAGDKETLKQSMNTKLLRIIIDSKKGKKVTIGDSKNAWLYFVTRRQLQLRPIEDNWTNPLL